MFDGGDDDADGDGRGADHGLPDVPEWPETEKLKFEKEALDFYISSHPLAQHDEQLRRFRTHECARDGEGQERHRGPHRRDDRRARRPHREQGPEHGRKYATFRIEDFTGTVRCILWSDEYARFKDLVIAGRGPPLRGRAELGARAAPSRTSRSRRSSRSTRPAREFTKSMLLKLPYTDDEGSLRKLDAVGLVLKRYRGTCPVYLSVRDANGKQVQLKLNDEFRVNPAALKVEELEMLLGRGRCFLAVDYLSSPKKFRSPR